MGTNPVVTIFSFLSACQTERVKMVSSFFVFVLAITSTVIEGAPKEIPSCYELTETRGINKDKLDIQLIIDSSGSLGADDFKKLLTYVADDFLPQIVAKDDKGAFVRVGVTSFGDSVQHQIKLGEQQATLTTLQEAVKNIPYIGGATVTAAALNQTLEEFKKNDRPNAPNVLVVITDGPPSNKDTFPVLPEAAKWDEISDIIVIAISNEIKLEEAKEIANNKEDKVVQVGSVAETKDVMPTLVKMVSPNAPRTNCLYCRARQTMMKTVDATVYVCDCEADNTFSEKQCGDKDCWCATEAGMVIEGSRKLKNETFDCSLERANYKKAQKEKNNCFKQSLEKGFKPECDTSGLYKVKQCLKDIKYCWCSLPSGVAIPRSIHHTSDTTKPSCYKLRDFRYVCTETGQYDHPFDQTRYMNCGVGKTYSCTCPKSLIFKNGLCVYNSGKS